MAKPRKKGDEAPESLPATEQAAGEGDERIEEPRRPTHLRVRTRRGVARKMRCFLVFTDKDQHIAMSRFEGRQGQERLRALLEDSDLICEPVVRD